MLSGSVDLAEPNLESLLSENWARHAGWAKPIV